MEVWPGEGIFEKITATVEAIFETLTAKTAEIASAVVEKLTVSELTVKEPAVGQAVIPAGELELLVTNSLITEHSRVFITFRDPYGPATKFWVSEVVAGERFTVTLDQPVSSDARFDWWVIN